MSLKAIFLNFNGVIIDDEEIHQKLIGEILLGENLRFDNAEYQQYCQGKSDRNGLRDILANRGRIVTEEYLTKLIETKARAYQQELEQLDSLPLYPNLPEFFSQLQEQGYKIALVTGALHSEVKFILQQAQLIQYFAVIVGGDDLAVSKPRPEGYLLAIEQLNQKYPELNLQPQECLAIEDNYIGIQAAKNAGIQVVGIANTYPLHMLQRQANWTVDSLLEIELDRVERVLSEKWV
ncbi:MAG: HAD family hydrolase [Pleurocapsa sp.]